jgi:hypothetical protein
VDQNPNSSRYSNRPIADELAESDADYAGRDTVSGEDVRDRYGLV